MFYHNRYRRKTGEKAKFFFIVNQWLRENLCHRKKCFAAAFCFLLLELFLMIGPSGWLREEKVNYLSGEGSWALEQSNEDGQAVCQVFTPQHQYLDSIGIVVVSGSSELNGYAFISVSDKDKNILFETEIPYSRLAFGGYTNIPMNLTLSKNQEYYLSIRLEKSTDGIQPYVGVCGNEMYMHENVRLICSEEIENVQLLTRYVYSRVVSNQKVLEILLLSIATALLAAVGVPDVKGFKRITGTILLLLIPYVLGCRLELLTISADSLLPQAMMWNMGIMYILELVLLLCTQSFFASVVMSDMILVTLYSVNYFVYTYRGVTLKLTDLKVVGTAMQVVSGYDYTPNSHLAMAWGVAALIAVAGWKLRGKAINHKGATKRSLAGRAALFAGGVFLATGSVYMLIYTDLLEEKGFENFQGWEKEDNYSYDGYLAGSCIDIRNTHKMLLDAPLGYSRQYAKEILERYECQNQETICEEDLPHVILIMNESFSDLRVLGDLNISEENLGYFYSLRENTVRGNVNASVLGGGTPNSEFEVLTGCTMGFFPQSYYPYQECMSRPVDSLVSILKSYGYKTYSMHPAAKGNWNRANVYVNLGFDETLWRDDFEMAKTIHYGVSDLETYRKIEALFENRERDEKLFIFDVTIQNHGGYTYEDNCPYNVKSFNVLSEEADRYLSLIKESDEAFSQLISYFAQEDEKVVICMFGDHQPGFKDDAFYNILYSLTEGLTDTDILFNQYKTPFVIWANYNISEMDSLDISMNYLGALLLDTIGIEGSAYFNYLLEQMRDYPIITINGYQDKSGNVFEWSGTREEFLEYRVLQYNYLFD